MYSHTVGQRETHQRDRELNTHSPLALEGLVQIDEKKQLFQLVVVDSLCYYPESAQAIFKRSMQCEL